MKAIGLYKALPITDQEALVELDLAIPTATDHDLLVEVKAVSVNPVDTKVRKNATFENDQPRVLGWDAVGIVKATGESVSQFQVGDRVWYAGDITKPGSNAEFQLIDERIVSKAPESLSDAEAAAIPLTAITAWELLFERLQIHHADPIESPALLVIGAAGGVGSILLQLTKQLTGVPVIATASRPESQAWVKEMGADFVINHHEEFDVQLKSLGIDDVTHVICLTHTDQYIEKVASVIRPEGKFALIDDAQNLNIFPLKSKSVSIHWEMMFTRSVHQTKTMARQGKLLQRVSELVDQGKVSSTLTRTLSGLTVENLRETHQQIESGTTKGKLVINFT
ncbi:zinc-binding alcohol dehydrogenase family protein [Marinomonas mediterranea]|uniref:zinc-binding alcohol dehydrogenase family protein n=1 Tax=Marinomonas mediterranea TaxID=119864 RepID=UPI00234937EA|nr:zinc-binding alcohol dehydrogenase family protein [Marinomonas mediterranea]WCN08188.1 zinc-binding alcohol dehydrogenase family protein [Marinomonas mediterranea]